MEIKKSAVDPMVAAIQKLNEPAVISEWDKDGNETKRTVRCIYDGLTTYRLAKNLKLLKAEAEVINDARSEMFKAREPDSDGSLKGKKAVEFQNEVKELLRQTVDLPLIQIPIADLKIGKGPGLNPVDTNAISDLMDTIVVGELTS